MAEALEAALRAVLRAAGQPAPQALSWQLLPGSSASRSYRVDAREARFVVRFHAADGDPVLPLGREHDLLRAVAAAGIGPDVVGIDPARRALVLRYVEADPWTSALAREPENIERAARLLARLHAVDAVARPFEPDRDAALYCERARRSGRFGDRDAALARELEALAASPEIASDRPYVLCHNDLVAANILDRGALLLVDFEYAVRAPALVDLASLAAMNDFGSRDCSRLLDAYAAAGRAAGDLTSLDQLVRLHRLLAYFWALGAESEALFARRASFADRAAL